LNCLVHYVQHYAVVLLDKTVSESLSCRPTVNSYDTRVL